MTRLETAVGLMSFMRRLMKWGGPPALLISVLLPIWDLASPWPPAARALSGGGPHILFRYVLSTDREVRTYLAAGDGGPRLIVVEWREPALVAISQRPAQVGEIAYSVLSLLATIGVVWWFWLRPREARPRTTE